MTADPSRALALPAALDPRTLDETRDGIAARLAAGDLALDGSAVQRVATVGLQLLLSAERSARDLGRAVSLRPSPALSAAISDLGLEPRFAAWIRA